MTDPETMPDVVERLAGLAANALQGPWHADLSEYGNGEFAYALIRGVDDTEVVSEMDDPDTAKYIAALDPQTVSALLAEITRLRAELASERERAEKAEEFAGAWHREVQVIATLTGAQEPEAGSTPVAVQVFAAERDALRARVEVLEAALNNGISMQTAKPKENP